MLVRAGDDRDLPFHCRDDARRAPRARGWRSTAARTGSSSASRKAPAAGRPRPARPARDRVPGRRGGPPGGGLPDRSSTANGGRWFIEEAGDRDPSGARLGAMLQVMLARHPASRRPEIRAWFPHALQPPQVQIVDRKPTSERADDPAAAGSHAAAAAALSRGSGLLALRLLLTPPLRGSRLRASGLGHGTRRFAPRGCEVRLKPDATSAGRLEPQSLAASAKRERQAQSPKPRAQSPEPRAAKRRASPLRDELHAQRLRFAVAQREALRGVLDRRQELRVAGLAVLEALHRDRRDSSRAAAAPASGTGPADPAAPP